MTPRIFTTVSFLGFAGVLPLAGCEEPPPPYPYAVTAAEQEATAGGTSVVIATVDTNRASWVVIHADDDGDFSTVLGKAAVATKSEGVKVTLDTLRKLEGEAVETPGARDGETLHALLYLDAGETGVWDAALDVALKSSEGAYAYASFKVNVNNPPLALSVEAANQTVDPPDQVTIAKVQAGKAGWVAVYDDNAGKWDEVLGRTAVAIGENLDVAVELSRDLEDGETLYAVLHDDLGTLGTWDYPGADARALDETGASVSATFVASLPPPGPTPAVSAKDQKATTAGEGKVSAVVVAEVTSVGAGWLAIHEDDGDGGYGGVIGVAAVPDGTTKNVTVELERPAVDGEMLHAILHTDSGNPGVFEFPGADQAVKLAAGTVVAASFEVDVPPVPSILVADQSLLDSTRVWVDQATSDGAGWVVIHEASGDTFGAAIGKLSIADGSTSAVYVTLDRAAEDGETLYAMLHADGGEPGLYEFPDGPDVPVGLPDGQGAEVMAVPFVVKVPVVPALSVADQTNPSPADTVTLASVSSEGPGWATIRDGSDGSELGHVGVAHGTSANLKVKLSRAMVDGETLYAVLHTDAGVVGAYEFPGADVPAKAPGGAEVQASFQVSIAP